jgi:hypothetical protein
VDSRPDAAGVPADRRRQRLDRRLGSARSLRGSTRGRRVPSGVRVGVLRGARGVDCAGGRVHGRRCQPRPSRPVARRRSSDRPPGRSRARRPCPRCRRMATLGTGVEPRGVSRAATPNRREAARPRTDAIGTTRRAHGTRDPGPTVWVASRDGDARGRRGMADRRCEREIPSKDRKVTGTVKGTLRTVKDMSELLR